MDPDREQLTFKKRRKKESSVIGQGKRHLQLRVVPVTRTD